MNKDFVLGIDTWFREYTSEYHKSKRIKLAADVKIAHTSRVVREMKLLAVALGLQDDDQYLALVIARLHDVGRFPQYATYGTFNDRKSENHAQLGLKVINENGLLTGLTSQERRWILEAVANHNRFSIEDDLDDRTGMFCRMIRDADKLDILKVLLDTEHHGTDEEKKAIFVNLPDTDEYSDTILQTLCSGVMGRAEDVRTRNDFRLIALGWVYDLYYRHSLIRFNERSYLVRFAELLPETKEISEAIECVRKFLSDSVSSHVDP